MHVRRWPLVWFYLVALAVIAVDQLTKAWATAALRPIGRMVIIPGFLNLRYLDGGNTGVAFGMFAGHGFLVGLFMIVLAGIAFYFTRGLNWAGWEPNLVGGCLLGGALGNMIDRARLGSVVDFVDCYLGSYHWPTFNVADSFICLAVGWIVVRQLTTPTGPKK